MVCARSSSFGHVSEGFPQKRDFGQTGRPVLKVAERLFLVQIEKKEERKEITKIEKNIKRNGCREELILFAPNSHTVCLPVLLVSNVLLSLCGRKQRDSNNYASAFLNFLSSLLVLLISKKIFLVRLLLVISVLDWSSLFIIWRIPVLISFNELLQPIASISSL